MIADYLKKHFENNNISQYEIERKIGMSQSKISLVLNNKRKLTADELLRIAIVFDLDLNKLKEIIIASQQ